MPHHYSPEDRAYALQRLIANSGDVVRTAAEIGINPRTLYIWRKNANLNVPNLKNLKNLKNLPPVSPSSTSLPIPSDDRDSFQNIKTGMLHNVNLLLQSVPEAITEASLGQRVTALIHLIDRIISLATQLPKEDEDEEIEYVLTDDVEEEDEEEAY